jgi:hypothetical protein
MVPLILNLHDSAALAPNKISPAPIVSETGWVPEPIWTLGNEKLSCLYYKSNHSLSLQIRKYLLKDLCSFVGARQLLTLQANKRK